MSKSKVTAESYPGSKEKRHNWIKQPTKDELKRIKHDNVVFRIKKRNFGDGLISYGSVPPKGYEALVFRNGVTLFFKEEKICLTKRSLIIIQKLLTKPLCWLSMRILKGMIWAAALPARVLRILKYILSRAKITK